MIPPEAEEVEILEFHLHVNLHPVLLQDSHLFFDLVELTLHSLLQSEIKDIIYSHLETLLSNITVIMNLYTLILFFVNPLQQLVGVVGMHLLSYLVLIKSVLVYSQYIETIGVGLVLGRAWSEQTRLQKRALVLFSVDLHGHLEVAVGLEWRYKH